jgi:two-component system sensor histidine kinase KdpD
VGVVLLVPFRTGLDRAVPALVLVLPVLASGAIGGRRPAIVTAIAAAMAVNVFFLPPYNTFRIALRTDTIALATFLAVAATVGALAARLGDRQRAAELRAEEMATMQAELEARELERQHFVDEQTRLAVLEQVDAQRSALLRSVSHDLRTPLATIRAVASDLRSGTVYEQEARNELLDLVGDEAERLDRLVANLLSLSRIESGEWQPTMRALDLDELLRERVRRLRRLFDQTKLILDVDPDVPLVDGDYTQLQQVVTNLLENAARHAPPQSSVVISVARSADGTGVVLRVRDEGVGVLAHEREQVFEPFRRGAASGTVGSGVGLAICKAIVEAHGGSIRVERTPGGGATFRVELRAWRGRVT